MRLSTSTLVLTFLLAGITSHATPYVQRAGFSWPDDPPEHSSTLLSSSTVDAVTTADPASTPGSTVDPVTTADPASTPGGTGSNSGYSWPGGVPSHGSPIKSSTVNAGTTTDPVPTPPGSTPSVIPSTASYSSIPVITPTPSPTGPSEASTTVNPTGSCFLVTFGTATLTACS